MTIKRLIELLGAATRTEDENRELRAHAGDLAALCARWADAIGVALDPGHLDAREATARGMLALVDQKIGVLSPEPRRLQR